MSRRLKWSLIAIAAAVVIIAAIAGFIFIGKDNATARAYTEDDYNRDVSAVMSSLLPELEAEIDAFKVVDPTIGQELAELSVLKILGKYQTANIELQVIQAPSGKVSDHEKLLETIRAGETECGALAKEYENGNYEADPEPCLSAFEELKRFIEK